MDDLFFERSVITNRDQLLRQKLLTDEEFADVGYIVKWECFTLDTQTGSAEITDQYHNFDKKSAPYKVFNLLLEKRVMDPQSGEVTFNDFLKQVKLDKKKVQSILADLRRELKIGGTNNQKNQKEDPFQSTSEGYKLTVPRSFRQPHT